MFDLLKNLSDAKVKFVLVGGLAVASIEHLIAMKSGTGRSKDQIDIEELRHASVQLTPNKFGIPLFHHSRESGFSWQDRSRLSKCSRISHSAGDDQVSKLNHGRFSCFRRKPRPRRNGEVPFTL